MWRQWMWVPRKKERAAVRACGSQKTQERQCLGSSEIERHCFKALTCRWHTSSSALVECLPRVKLGARKTVARTVCATVPAPVADARVSTLLVARAVVVRQERAVAVCVRWSGQQSTQQTNKQPGARHRWLCWLVCAIVSGTATYPSVRLPEAD